MRRREIIVACIVITAVSVAAAEVPAGYHVRSLHGFTLLIRDDVLRQPADRWQRTPMDVLDQEFADLRRVVGPKVLPIIQAVPVWVSWDSADPTAQGIVAVYYGGTGKELERLGQSPLKANCIEIIQLRRLGELRPPGAKFQQVITLHEMAHAVHHRLLGMDSAEVKSAFQQAVERRLYDHVVDRFHRRGRAYARTNEAEYFAEISCAYLDTCHFFPFNYSDLKEHDPVGFALMENVWKRPEQFVGRVAAFVMPQFATKAATNTPQVKSNVEMELAAYQRLDQGRSLQRAGKILEARQTYQDIVSQFPNTMAAADARKLLDKLP